MKFGKIEGLGDLSVAQSGQNLLYVDVDADLGTFSDGKVIIGIDSSGSSGEKLVIREDAAGILNARIINNASGTGGSSSGSVLYFGMLDGDHMGLVGYTNTNFNMGSGYELLTADMMLVGANPLADGGILLLTQYATAPIVFGIGGFAAANEVGRFSTTNFTTLVDHKITKVDPELRLTDTGNDYFTRWSKTDTANKMMLKNKVDVAGANTQNLSYQLNFVSGSSECMSCDLTTSSTTLTLEAWIRTTAVGAWSGMVGNMMANGVFKGIGFTFYGDNKVSLTIGTGAAWVNAPSDAVLNDGLWHHCVGTYDGVTGNLYIDGVLQAAPSTVTISNSNQPFIAGRFYADNDSNYFDGEMDEIRIWGVTQDQTYVTAAYNSGFGTYGADAAGLLAGWHFDEGTGTSVADYSGNSHTGTLLNTPTWQAGEKANDLNSLSYAASFNGTSDYAYITDHADFDFGTGDFTIEIWVFPMDIVNTDELVSKAAVSSLSPWRIYNDVGNWSLISSSAGAYWDVISYTDPAVFGTVEYLKWQYLVLTRVGNDFNCYKNGVLGTPKSSALTVWDNGENVNIARLAYSSPFYGKGFMGGIKFYKGRSFSAAEVLAKYNAGFGIYGATPDTDLVAGYNFTEGTGTDVADYSGNSHGMTLSGATWKTGEKALDFNTTIVPPSSQEVTLIESYDSAVAGEKGIHKIGGVGRTILQGDTVEISTGVSGEIIGATSVTVTNGIITSIT